MRVEEMIIHLNQNPYVKSISNGVHQVFRFGERLLVKDLKSSKIFNTID